ncbi:MAG: 50S ribosomal protein L32 [Cyanobacteriota/Melainabacteria group bacterium]
MKYLFPECSNCGAQQPHRIYPECEYYRGRPAFKRDAIF